LEDSKDKYPELTYYFAHYSITKMQIDSIKERIEAAQFDQTNKIEKALIEEFQFPIFGEENATAVANVFRPLLDGYQY